MGVAVPPEQMKRDVAADILRDAITSGRLAPGLHLGHQELAQLLNLSATPIREALSILETEGLVIQRPHRGAIVTPLDRDELLELYALRPALEALAIRHAVPELTDGDIEALGELLERMDAFDSLSPEFLALDGEFHARIYRASGVERWQNTIDALRQRSLRYMIAGSRIRGIETVRRDHRAIFEGCRRRDADEVVELTHVHLVGSRDLLLEQFEWVPVRGPKGQGVVGGSESERPEA
jgi:DNA-binding GntR family transcriptional regulator